MVSGIKGRGGSFVAGVSFKLDNNPMPFEAVEVKIDTGCSLSTIPLRRYRIAETVCKKMKRIDIQRSLDYVISYGVETGGTSHIPPITLQEKLDCEAVR